MTHFHVSFEGFLPDTPHIGDQLAISGTAIVQAIWGDLVDVTALGDPSRSYSVGELTIDLVSNRLEVRKP